MFWKCCQKRGFQCSITMTTKWALFQSPASRLFFQTFVHAQIKENIKASRHCPLWGNSPVTGEFSAQGANNAENATIWLRHHVSGSQDLKNSTESQSYHCRPDGTKYWSFEWKHDDDETVYRHSNDDPSGGVGWKVDHHWHDLARMIVIIHRQEIRH